MNQYSFKIPKLIKRKIDAAQVNTKRLVRTALDCGLVGMLFYRYEPIESNVAQHPRT